MDQIINYSNYSNYYEDEYNCESKLKTFIINIPYHDICTIHSLYKIYPKEKIHYQNKIKKIKITIGINVEQMYLKSHNVYILWKQFHNYNQCVGMIETKIFIDFDGKKTKISNFVHGGRNSTNPIIIMQGQINNSRIFKKTFYNSGKCTFEYI